MNHNKSNTEKELLKQLNSSLNLLVESKNNEIDFLKKDNQRLGNPEQEFYNLKRRLESLSSVDRNNTTNNNNNNDTPSNTISHDTPNDAIGDNITIKTEENELSPCQAGNKKRRIDS
jgi:uncharacterized membrane protein YgaE (UPF0421/DUF939 family)